MYFAIRAHRADIAVFSMAQGAAPCGLSREREETSRIACVPEIAVALPGLGGK